MAVETSKTNGIKRAYTIIIENYSAEELRRIFEKHISKEATVYTDEWTGYSPLIFGMRIEDLISFDEKYVLNNYGEIKGNQIGLNNFPAELKNLYEDKIKLLEDKISYQQEIINDLKSK